MCMLTFLPEYVQPNASHLSNGGLFNNDAHGYAIVVPATATDTARLIVNHSLDLESLILEFMYDRADYPRGPALFHSRYGTCGSSDIFNAHPFQVGHSPQTVVAHNGILPKRMQPGKGDRRCDTRLAADDIFPGYGRISKKANRNRLGHDIGGYNKLVFLTIDPAYPEHAYIVNEDSGIWTAEGIWYSNSDYEPYTGVTRTFTYTSSGTQTPADTVYYAEDCRSCYAKDSINPATDLCEMCDSCADCLEVSHACLCWTPAHKEQAANDPAYADSYRDDPDADYDYYARDYEQGYSPTDALANGLPPIETTAPARGMWAGR